MDIPIHGTAHGDAREMLEAARSLGPRWLQGLSNGKVTVQFTSHQDIPHGDLLFLADTHGFDLKGREERDSGWTAYYFE